MNILLTGAFGNIGSMVLNQLLQRGHHVTCLDLPNKANQKTARRYAHNVDILWGDIRNSELLSTGIQGKDAIIHMAAIIPPFSEAHPQLAQQINVQATGQMLDIAAQQTTPPLFIFTSSFAVFGPQQKDNCPRTIADPLIASDHYSEQKITGEQYIRQRAERWCILRLGAAVDERMFHTSLEQLRLALALACDNRVEYIHPKDIATAIANALESTEAHNKIHLIGGGPSCQIRHIDLLNTMAGAMGITFKPEDFSDQPLYADWADTRESQQLLKFQQHSFNDLKQTVYRKFLPLRLVVRPFSPLIRFVIKRWIIRQKN